MSEVPSASEAPSAAGTAAGAEADVELGAKEPLLSDIASDPGAASAGAPVLRKASQASVDKALKDVDEGVASVVRVGELIQVDRDGRTAGNTIRLMYHWALVNIPFYLEIVVLVGLAYYADVYLDIQAIYVFWERGHLKYTILNCLAMVFANVYAFLDMLRAVPETDTGSLTLLIGFLTPLFGHIAVLCWVSLRAGKKHPLLDCGKLAEAALEAFISSLVQTYALIYSDWKGNHHQQQLLGLSVCSSFLSIGYAFMCFDRRDVGLNGVPGVLDVDTLDPKMMLVLLARVAEVASRITSIALFSVATRKVLDLSFVYDWPSPFNHLGYPLENYVFLTLGPCLVMLDFFVILLMTIFSQWKNPSNCLMAIPSILCYINPLLEAGNPFTVRAPIYYGWRAAQLIAMSGAVYWDVRQENSNLDKLKQNMYIMYVCVGSTLGCFILVPIVRCMADHSFFLYSDEMFGAQRFNTSQHLLKDELLMSQVTVPPTDAAKVSDYQTLAIADEIEDTLGAKMQRRAQVLLASGISELRKTTAAATGQKRMNSKLQKKQGNAADADGKKDDFIDEEERKGFSDSLYLWGQRYVKEIEESERVNRSSDEIFSRVLTLGANIIPRSPAGPPAPDQPKWVSCVEKLQHHEFLKSLAEAMSDRSVLTRAVDNMETFLSILPTWQQWTDDPCDKKLHMEKIGIIHSLGLRGWESRGWAFLPNAKKLHEALDTQFCDGSNDAETLPKRFSGKPASWEEIAQRQTRTLVELWRSMKLNHKERLLRKAKLADLFRLRVEWEAMVQGAEIMFKKWKQAKTQPGEAAMATAKSDGALAMKTDAVRPAKPRWPTEDLLHFCEVGWEAIYADVLLDETPQKKSVEKIQENVRESVEAQIGELVASFEALVRSEKLDSKDIRSHDFQMCVRELESFERLLGKGTSEADLFEKMKEMREKCAAGRESCKNALKKLEADEKLKAKEKEDKVKEHMRQAEEQQKHLQKELEEKLKQREEMDKKVERERGEAARLRRIARKEQMEGRRKRKELKKKVRRARLQASNGMVVAVKVADGIADFEEYLRGNGSEKFGSHLSLQLADWLGVPQKAVSIEEDAQVDGSMTVAFAIQDASDEVWQRLKEHEDEVGSLSRTSDGLSVQVTDVNQEARQFSIVFEGVVSHLADQDTAHDSLEEVEMELGLDEGVLGDGSNLDVVEIGGELTVRAMLNLQGQIREKIDSGNRLQLPRGLRCDIEVEGDQRLDLDDEESSMTSALSPHGGRQMGGLSTISDSEIDDDDDSDF